MVNKDYSQTEQDNEESLTDQKVDQNTEDVANKDVDSESVNQNIDEQALNSNDEELSAEQIEIAKLKQEVEEKQNRVLRVQADLENYRRRVRLDQEAAAKYRAQSLIENIIPALDNFERALQVEAKEDETKQLLKGMEMVHQLHEALKTEGVEVIEAVGKEFDPNFHQAVMQVEDENFDSNIVVEELQKGYLLKDRVIRPSMVKVNQ